MKKRIIEEIKNNVKLNQYDLTYHAYEKMAEDGLSIIDIENAILTGELMETQQDIKGSKYIISGNGRDLTTRIGIVGRIKETGIFLIITLYVINE